MACERGGNPYYPAVSSVAETWASWIGPAIEPMSPRLGRGIRRSEHGPGTHSTISGSLRYILAYGSAGCRQPWRNMSLPPCRPTGRRALEGTQMRSSSALIVFAVLALMTAHPPAATAAPRAFLYLSPVPGADMVSRWNNVVIRQGSALDRASLDALRRAVGGSVSGAHSGRFQLGTRGRTVRFT